ncbi:hypothetical protein [Microbacterium sp. YY-01]|uniref:hypothetical protein n=1 Tax=Microbacterium sp. YY-01 TaxID=3421634 RepID=UPI003D1638C0
MSSDSNDDALQWEGDEEAAPSLPTGWRAVGKGSERVEHETDVEPAVVTAQHPDAGDHDTVVDDSEPAPPISTAGLVGLGVVSGVYLLFAVGWLIGGVRLRAVAQLIVNDAMFTPWLWLAVAAPFLWFAAAWLLTRRQRWWVRALALVAGIVVMVPWPFVMVGAIGV